jgi:hypothetical protein
MRKLFSNFNLSEGLNLGVSEYLNKEGECREAIGCDFSEIGALARFPGYTPYGTGLDASKVLGLYDFKTTAGATKWIAGTGTVLYYDNAGTWTSAHTGLTTGLDMSFATHLDTVIMANGTDVIHKSTNGTSWSDLGGTPPVAKYVLSFDNKFYALNLAGYTSRMRWTDDGTIETWTATNIQDVATNIGVGDQLTGGAVNNNSLIAFKNYSTWKWDTYELLNLSSSVGCRAPKSIATIDAWTFFLSHRGLEVTKGSEPFRISNPIKDYVEAISDITAPVGWVDDNFYYLYIGTVTVKGETISNAVLIYDYDNNKFSVKPMGVALNSAFVMTTSGNVRNMYVGDTAGQVHKFKFGNNDNSSAIPFKWKSGPMMSGLPENKKDYQVLLVYSDRTAKEGVSVFYSVDFKDFRPLGTANKVVNELKFPTGTRGYNIRIAYSANATTDQQKICGHVCLGEILPNTPGDVE